MGEPALMIHVPRTGFTSIARTLQDNADGVSFADYPAPEEPYADVVQFVHATPAWLVRFGRIDRALLRDRLVFAGLRNPWDRLLSGYCACAQSPRAAQRQLIEEHGPDFERFAEWVVSGAVPPMIGTATKDGRWANPQVDWLMVEGELVVDELLRYETLHQDWRRLRRRLGVTAFLRPSNVTVHRYYRQYYPPRLRTLVGDFYADDCALGSYTF